MQLSVKWFLENNTEFVGDAETSVVSAHGALIKVKAAPPLQQKVKIENSLTKETQEARVVFVSQATKGFFKVGLEFTKPNPCFWHVSFPPEDWSVDHPDAKVEEPIAGRFARQMKPTP